MPIAIIVIILGAIGFADSLYYTLIHYGYFGFHSPLVPMICDKEVGACHTLARSSWASLFGLPNSVFGMVFYVLVIVAAVMRLRLRSWPYLPVLAAASIVAALVSAVLAWAMIFKLQTFCPLCFTAQIINIVLAVIFVMLAK